MKGIISTVKSFQHDPRVSQYESFTCAGSLIAVNSALIKIRSVKLLLVKVHITISWLSIHEITPGACRTIEWSDETKEKEWEGKGEVITGGHLDGRREGEAARDVWHAECTADTRAADGTRMLKQNVRAGSVREGGRVMKWEKEGGMRKMWRRW